jgi:gluconate 5-dehydrogenase
MTDPQSWFNLSGKCALITGSYRGIGYAMAEALGKSGAKVIINGRSKEGVAKAVDTLKAEGVHATGKCFDVSDEAAVNQAVEEIERDIAPINILINNAGIQDRNPITELDLAQWENVLKVNLTGPFMLTKAVAQRMIPRKWGKIINICSVISQVARPTISNYAASKGAIVMLTKSMAIEWAQHTSLVEDKEFNAWICNRTPAGRWGTPEDLAGAALFLSSEAANYMTGQVLYVEGGLLSSL